MESVTRHFFRNLVSEMHPVYYIADFCHEPLVSPPALHLITLKFPVTRKAAFLFAVSAVTIEGSIVLKMRQFKYQETKQNKLTLGPDYFLALGLYDFNSVKVRDFLIRKRGPTGPFIKDPEKFSHPESHRKISNLMILELFYSQNSHTCE